MVLPALLDGAPGRRIATRKRSCPPGRVHHTLACGSALAHTRVLPAKGSTGTHDLLKVPIAANFVELRLREVRRIPLLRGWVNRASAGVPTHAGWHHARCRALRRTKVGKEETAVLSSAEENKALV